ncbi:MAG: preprotein translocase subunit SecG [Parcubacteria group bacterium RIFOXYD2_FULL_52_8]|nr:MAG: preprotein translocase subunit SecG [Parcubacteria group bacterium RIFOXYD2_FULL_52_8]
MELLRTAIPYAQIVLSVILVALVLVQQNDAGVGAAFGGGQDSSFHVKRGAEKTIFVVTIIVSILFVATAIIALVL